jgi:transposase
VADWLAAHVRKLEYFGGVPRASVPDNPKSAVHRTCRYEPDLNPSYQDFTELYGVAILPARVRNPRAKATVEGAVQCIERWILAPLRHQSVRSLAEVNQALRAQLEPYYDQPFSRETGDPQMPVPRAQPASTPNPATAPL